MKSLSNAPAYGPPPPPDSRTGGYLSIARGAHIGRAAPTSAGIARRRWLINASKFLLPAGALILLGSIAIWPELDRATDRAHAAMHAVRARIDGVRLTEAHYDGMDEHGRPYTVTAATAVQREQDLVDLTLPNADMTLESGVWLNVKSKQGVYARGASQLDLSNDVVLYRDDGTTLRTSSVSVEMKSGAASSAQPTHVEGPFGTLDALGFTMTDKGAAIQFWGPAHVEMNGASK